MDTHQLGRLPLHTGYVFENGTPFYEKLGDERAAALLKALEAHGYRIVRGRDGRPRLRERANTGALPRVGS